MHRWLWPIVAFAAGGLLAPTVALASWQEVPGPTSSAGAPSHQHLGRAKICFDALFFAALPGKTNYCLGLRDWQNGHYESGLKLFKLAAGWGNKNAQYTLGLIYYNGHHVARNRALGMAWLKLADQRHNDAQITIVTRSVTQLASPAERTKANQLYAQMLKQYGDKVAATRAWHHLGHWQRSHSRTNTGTVCLYGAQLYAMRHAGVQGMAPPAVSDALYAARLHKNPGAKKARSCFGISVQMKHHVIQKSAGTYFAGWMGVVTVGPLKAVPAPAASSNL